MTNREFLKDMRNFEKLDKFAGQDFRRWQKKMHFMLTNLTVVYVLSTPMPEIVEDETLEQARRRLKWENDDYICSGHILNGIIYLNDLFEVGMEKGKAELSTQKYRIVSTDKTYRGEIQVGPDSLRRRMSFPHSLKKLDLSIHPSECWQGLLDKIGLLPLLQKLKLQSGRFEEGQWETTEGQFPSLKFLSISKCNGLEFWKTESSHFPCLERLRLRDLWELKEIPLDFAEISTLRVIEVYNCRNPAVESAKSIYEEQVELYGEEDALQVQVGPIKLNKNK
ncbi:hypothetical protein OROHE_014324 [Orobanche hederae]